MSVRCPCGGGELASCCQPLLANVRQAETAEELMRSRYTAFALGNENHLFRTWHPRTRPAEVSTSGMRWTGLEILEVSAGGSDDDAGEVEFIASWRQGSTRGQLHERSRFARRAGRWFYLDGDQD